VPRLHVRWSGQEARKPYARPFGVSFIDDSGASLGAVAVSGSDLLYYRQFKAAVLALGGELFAHDGVEDAADQQLSWLNVIAGLIPCCATLTITPHSEFHGERGRVFRFTVAGDGAEMATVDAPTLLEYQEFQAALAHQSGALFRDSDVEAIEDVSRRGRAWERALQGILLRPDASEAMAASWPWR